MASTGAGATALISSRPVSADSCFVGVDLGTSGCRAIAIDRTGELLHQTRAPLPPSLHHDDGCSEQQPGDWWQALVACLRALPETCRTRLAALAIDGTSGSVLLCNRHGEPLGPALMYDDRRATAAAARIADVATPDSPARGASSALAKLLWLLDRHRGNRVLAMHQADWLAARMTGKPGISDENNALKMGYDPVARHWPDWLLRLPIDPRTLPSVVPVGSLLGRIDPTVADLLELPRDTLIAAGTTDSNAAALAAGMREPGDAVTSLGSTLVLKVLSPQPVTCATNGIYSHRIGDRWLTGGASNSGGAVLRRYFSDVELAALSAEIDPQKPCGLDYYPLIARGERFPHNDPDLAPRLTPQPDDRVLFLHGLLEGIAAIEAAGYRRLSELGAPYPRKVTSSGGGAANTVWQAIRARRLGVPVERATHPEAAYGSALLARDAGLRARSDAP